MTKTDHLVASGRTRSQTEAPQAGLFDEAGQRVAKARDRLSELIGALNHVGDRAFGSLPTGVEAKSAPQAAGAVSRMLQEIDSLEEELPALATAIDRFAGLA
jgi:hypothetical protein